MNSVAEVTLGPLSPAPAGERVRVRGGFCARVPTLLAVLLASSLLCACSTSDGDDDLIVAGGSSGGSGGNAGAGGTGGSGGAAGAGGSGGTAGAGGAGGSAGAGGAGGSAGGGGAGGSAGAGGTGGIAGAGGTGGAAGSGGAGGSAGAGGGGGSAGSGGAGGGTGGAAGSGGAGGGAGAGGTGGAIAPQGAWLKGDTHVHDDHSSDGSLPRQTIGQGAPGNTSVAAQILFAETTGLHWLPLTDHRTFDQHYDPQWRSDKLLLLTGEEANSRPHAIVLGATDMINQADNPPGTSTAQEFRKLQQSIWDAQLQGAAWSTAHPDDGEVNDDGTPNPFAFATGPHLVEVWNRGSLTRRKIAYCEERWNAGYRFGIAAASDTHFIELWPVAGPGTPATHVFARERSTPALLEALRAGRSVVNLDALAPFATLEGDFNADGVFETLAGDEAQPAPGAGAKLRVTVQNGVGAQVLVYRAPGSSGAPFRTFQPAAPTESFEFDITADRAQDWYRVELRGPGPPDAVDQNRFLDGDPVGALDPDLTNQLRAITSPIFISTGAKAAPLSPDLPADQGADDGAAALFGSMDDNAFAGFADVAEANGVVHAVAEVRTGGASRVLYRRGASAPVDIAPASKLAFKPRVAASGQQVWIAWQDGRAGELPHRPQIYLRHSADGGVSWEPEQQVSASSARAEHPDLALTPDGKPVVTWQDNGSGAFDVYARVIGVDVAPVNLSATGKSVSAGTPLDTRSPRHPASVHARVAVRADGLIAVAWQDNRNDVDPGWTGHMTQDPTQEEGTETDDWEIFTVTRAAGSGAWSGIVNASNAPALADRHAALAFAPGGGLELAWDSKPLDPAGPRLALHASRSNDGGATWSAAATVAAAPEFSSQRPEFGVTSGGLSLLWMDGRSADWRWRVMRADLAGADWVNPRVATGRGNSAWPAFSNGWLIFTSDRGATREQRKPQQVFLLALDGGSGGTGGSGGMAGAGGSGGASGSGGIGGSGGSGGASSGLPLCDPTPAGLGCLSDIPLIGALLQDLINSIHNALLGESEAGLTRYVDPRIGSYPPGFTNPGPVLPFGMVALGPDTEGPLNYGGYSVQNLLLSGFSHVHMSAGVFKGGQIPVLPFTGEYTPGDLIQLGWPNPVPAYASPFDRAQELAEPGYYATTLLRYGVFAELTATERVGLHRYTFQNPAQPPRLLLDVSRALGTYQNASASLQPDGTLLGQVHSDDAGGYEVFFAARFNAPFTAQTFSGSTLAAGQTLSGNDLGLILDFANLPAPLLVKVGISYTDIQGALNNLAAEMPGWDFDAVRAAAKEKWEQALSRILVEGGTEPEKKSFYTALYRLHHFPNLHSDVDGRYRGPDGAIHADTRPHYSQFSSWDSYRGQNALQAEIFPEIYGDMLRSLLAFHEQAGFLPRWRQGPGDASHMSGDPMMPFIGEAWCRGQLDETLRAQLWPALTNLVARRPAELAQLGYLPVSKPANLIEQIEGGSGRAGTTLEFGIADFALALMAQSAAPNEAAAIARRSLNYRNLLDAESGWIRPRHDDRSYLTPFFPELGYGFQEGTSWQYSWLAMQDYAGLIAGMGGDSTVNQRLDVFFGFPASLAPLVWPTIQNQITLFGIAYYGNQFAPGNEHDLETPYVYNYAGSPWKTQAVARAAASIYTPTPNGLPGNDDLGALSGWLLWTMVGLYPINPGTPLYVVGSPHFEKVTLRRASGDLVIEAPGASLINRFVTGMQINGAAAERSWLVLPRGAATVRLTTDALPDMNWASAPTTRPPSLSTHGLADFGCIAASAGGP